MSGYRKLTSVITVVVSLMVAFAAAVPAATYYVSTSGNDSNDGSQSSPWRTIQRGANAVQAGDLVLVADGTYGGVAIDRSGTSSAPIVFRADGNNVVINSDNPSTPDNVNIEGADYVTFDGFKVEDGTRAGIRIAVSTGVTIQNNVIQRCGRWGIFTAFTPEIKILDNVCAAAVDEHGIYVSNSDVAQDRPVVRGNECYGNGHNGIQFNGDCTSGGDGTISQALIEDNFVHDNGWKGFSLISLADSEIRNNVLYNNGTAGVGAGGVHFADEPGCSNPSSNNVLVNNTIVEFNIACVRMTNGSTSNVVFNNITIADDLSDTIVDEVGGNFIDGASNHRATVTSGLFENAAARDYHLSASSPAVDAGINSLSGQSAPAFDIEGNSRPDGGTYDIGAYELQGSSPPPPPPPASGEHPRVWFADPTVLSRLRANACYDENGNFVSNCTQTSQWLSLKALVDDLPDKANAMDFALVYMITQNQSYANQAISVADGMVSGGWDRVRSENYRFLYVRDYLREMGCVYDWLYDQLDATRRQDYLDYMLMLLYLSWNEDSVAQSIYDVGGWGNDNPGNNFYYNFICATAYAAVAIGDDMPSTFTWAGSTHPFKLPFDGTDYNDLYDYLYARFDQQAIPDWLNTYGKGGGWHEGNQYGPSSKRHMFEAWLIIKLAGGKDYFNDPSTNFPKEAALYHIYATQPGGDVLYAGGDAGREPTFGVYDYDRHLMLELAWGLEGHPESGYAQWWLNHLEPDMSLKQLRGLDFLLYRPDLTPSERNLDELPLSYYSPGYGWMNSRSSWGSDAISISFVSADNVIGHQHNDQNSFQFYRGTSESGIKGWLVTDVQPFATGLRGSTEWHNTIIVDNDNCQRYGVGTGSTPKFEYTDDYTYVVGDASDAYWTNQKSSCNSDVSNGDKQLNVFQRELVHIRPGYVILFDRISPINPNSDIDNIFHYHNDHQAIPVAANTIESANGGGKVFHKVLLPESPNIATFDEQIGDSQRLETWRAEIRDYSDLPNRRHMSVFYITHDGVINMPDVLKMDEEQGKMVGTKIEDAAEDIILWFSTDPEGDPPAGSIRFQYGLRSDSIHYLLDLLPDTEYSVDIASNNGLYTIEVKEGKGYRSSANGVLIFEIHEPSVVVQH
jgi:hypothetical protein